MNGVHKVFALSALALAASCHQADEPLIESSEHALQGYGEALWNPADDSNFTPGNRTVEDINRVVIHTAQGYYSGTQYWFQDPVSNVSAHYVIRSTDGEVTQMVDDSDYAWHVECFNTDSIGIEHEGFVEEGADWYTGDMYEGSARLVAWLSNTYLIPIDRDHIFGHDESGCTTHNDPGLMWDWDVFMPLVEQYAERSNGAELLSVDAPERMSAGEYKNVQLTLHNSGNYTWATESVTLGVLGEEVSPFAIPYWIDETHASGPDGTNNFAGQEVSFTFPIQAPTLASTQLVTQSFQLVDSEGSFFGPVIDIQVEVQGSGGEEPGEDELQPGEDSGSTGGCSTGGNRSGLWAMMALMLMLAAYRRPFL